MRRTSLGRLSALVAVLSASLIGACSEKLDGGANCAAATLLCPGQSVSMRDTIIDPTLTFDSTYAGFPSLGAELAIPLVGHGNDLETIGVIRFDTLTTQFVPPNDTLSNILYVDSVFLKVHVDIARAELADSVRIDLYDVGYPNDDDTTTAPILARITPQFRVGGKTYGKAEILDSIFVPISDSALLARLRDSTYGWPRFRIGIKASGSGPVALRMGTVESGVPAQLLYRPKNDTSVHQLIVPVTSAGPTSRSDVQRDLLDYGLVLKSAFGTPAGTMTLGGVPGRRAYLRFNLPRQLTDSTTILRATLRLTQVPYAPGSATDTVVIFPHIVLAGPAVTDFRRATALIGQAGLVVADSLVLVPTGSGVRELELYPLVRAWGAAGSGANVPPRAVVLTTQSEGSLPRVIAFGSTSGASASRPRMRITYIPKIDFGVP